MSTLKRIWKTILNWLDDWFIYAVTLISVMFSSQFDALKAGEPITLNISSGVFILSALAALGITAYSESLKKDESGTVDKSREGRKRHFWSRVGKGIAFGIMWPQILELFLK